MKIRLGLFLVLASALVAIPEAMGADERRFSIEFEAGPAWQTRNDVRVPNDTGTKLSLRDLQGSGPFAAGRVSLAYRIAPKHEISVLVAPLTITSTGRLRNPVLFDGKYFAAGPGVEATYRFNSYRLTYRYRIYSGDRWTWKIGITGKIRNAKIKLQNATTSAVNDNLGLVPLLHLDGERRITERWKLHLNMDGLAAPQGRAFDISVKAKYDLSKSWAAAVGYRVLEGGADVDTVYTFAWLHYAVASIAFRF